jgi:PKD repeat protein
VVITVQSPPPVVTAFTATPQTGSAPLLDVDFAFKARAGAGKSLVQYTLEYGDGRSITEEGFSEPWPSTLERTEDPHTYGKAGAYTARVTVWDDAGRKATKELEITVTVTG